MVIPFKVVERGQPGVVGGGEHKCYATAVTNGESTLESLTKGIKKISTVSGADIRASLYSLVDVSIDDLGEAKIVRLGDLGSLRISISSKGEASENDVTSKSIRGGKVIFTPGKRIKELLKTLEYKKM